MHFDTTLDVLDSLKDQGQLFISLSPPFTAVMEVDRQDLQNALASTQLSEPDFKRQADVVGSILVAILNDSTEDFIQEAARQHQAHQEGPPDLSSEELHTQGLERVEKVKSKIYDNRLQRRYDLKRTSKAPSFTNIDWDIKVKRLDANLSDFSPFPYATCRISFQKEFDDSPFTFFGGRTFEAVQINFSEDEIDYLVRVLSGIKDHLANIEKEETQ